MRDRTAQTEPLTIGQQLVARWESIDSGWGEPADLAEAIDDAIAAEREACAKLVESAPMGKAAGHHVFAELVELAAAIRSRT